MSTPKKVRHPPRKSSAAADPSSARIEKYKSQPTSKIVPRTSSSNTMGSNNQSVDKNKFRVRRVVLFVALAIVVSLGWKYNQNNVQSLLGDYYSSAATTVDFAVHNGTKDTSGLISLDENDSFSACLLIMDDNYRLPEWLAYHWYALPLRHLVVAVDPHSKTSPSEILDQWRDMMTIEVWTNDSFTKSDLIIRESDRVKTRTSKHRTRQNQFYQACVKHLQKQNRTWTAFHDVDEYMTVNGDVLKGVKETDPQPGVVLRVVKTFRETAKEDRPAGVSGSWWYDQYKKTCITIARILLSAAESPPEEIANGVPQNINPILFDTLRYRYRHSRRGKVGDGLAKSIIDVSRVGRKDYGKASAHRPLKNICPSAFVGHGANPLEIYHYIGSWEAYSYREDARDGLHRTYKRWKQKAFTKKGGIDDHMRHWIPGFVKQVGENASKILFRDQGLPPGYKKNSTLLAGQERKAKLPHLQQPPDNTTDVGADQSTSAPTGEEDPMFEDEIAPANSSSEEDPVFEDEVAPATSSIEEELHEENTSSQLSFARHLVTASKNDSFSACLLIMDDNFRLSEWLAYHYYSLPLRYLVVAVDPHSKTSPTKVLDQWRDKMTIVEWSDSNFTKDNLIISQSDSSHKRTAKHRKRQGVFYHSCIRHLQKQNRTWTAFIDVDEFLTINGDVVEGAAELVSQQSNVLPVVRTFSETAKEERSTEFPEFWYDHFQQSHCITIARVLVNAIESSDEELSRGIPSAIDPKQFDTLRWRYRHSRRSYRDGPAKSIIDVSRVVPKDFGAHNAHRPLRGLCPNPFLNYNRLPLGIYHYLGSWESYSYREDARDGLHRSRDRWMQRATKNSGGVDDHMRHWITGFVNMVGEDSAKQLFSQQGFPPGVKSNSSLAIAVMNTAA